MINYKILRGDISIKEQERLRLCEEYHQSICHTYLEEEDVKNLTGDNLFLALIDYEDSMKYRMNNNIIPNHSLFPLPTIIGNIDGSIYDFNHQMFLDLDKYTINYAVKFSDIVDDDYWYFSTNEYGGISIYPNFSHNQDTKTPTIDKFILWKMKLGFQKYDLHDKEAESKVLTKRR